MTSSYIRYGSLTLWAGVHHARHAALASPGFSWLCIDCEHGLIALQGAGGALDSITGVLSSSANPPAPIVRIPATGTSTGIAWQIKLALDAGAKGVMVPMIGNAKEAKEVADSARFPTAGGKRGFGNPITHEVSAFFVWHASSTEHDCAALGDHGFQLPERSR